MPAYWNGVRIQPGILTLDGDHRTLDVPVEDVCLITAKMGSSA